MKKNYSILLTVAACQKNIENQYSYSKEGTEITTRSMDFNSTDYYVGEGLKAPLRKAGGKFYVVFNSAVFDFLNSGRHTIRMKVQDRCDWSGWKSETVEVN